jgi:hypothetical protein
MPEFHSLPLTLSDALHNRVETLLGFGGDGKHDFRDDLWDACFRYP